MARYVEYARSHSQLQHRDYFFSHKEDEYMRQQFDPRRLEETVKERTTAAAEAAAAFDAADALKADAEQPVRSCRAHSAVCLAY